MRIQIISIGGRMPAWVGEGFREYAQRMPPNIPLELLELPLGARGKGDPHKALEQEGQRMRKAIADQARVIALEPGGKQHETEAVAGRMRDWLQEGRDVIFLIGGPDGLAESCRSRADERWSLSRLTFPHMLVRVVLAEQLYRAWTIINNHPYHR